MTLIPVAGGSGMPPEPDWQSIYADVLDLAAAHDEWEIVSREMQDAGTLALCNGHAMKRLVEFRVQYERSARHVAEFGPVMKGKTRKSKADAGGADTSKHAKVGQWNPHWSVMRQADEAIRVLEAELGLAPVRRGKAVKVQRGKKAARPADQYLKAVSS